MAEGDEAGMYPRPDYRLIICGSRQVEMVNTFNGISYWLYWAKMPFPTAIISGCAKGPDLHGLVWARQESVREICFPANWKLHGKGAGHIRNQQMIDEGKADGVLAIWNGTSPGTADMINRGKKAKLDVLVYYPLNVEECEIVRNRTQK